MTDKLKIDLHTVDDVARGLGLLRREFEEAGEIADEARESLGSDRIADALRDSAHDWRVHRKRLLGELEDLHSLAASTSEAFRTVEAGLVHTLTAGAK